MNNQITVSIIGVGNRGGEAYGRYMNRLTNRYKITNLCEPNTERLNKYGETFGVLEENRFNDSVEFFKKKRSNLLVIATPDKLHFEYAKKAIELGYNVLLEKPISDNKKELLTLVKEAENSGKIIMVCHVLRYTAMVKKLKEVLDSGAIGKLISIDHTENVAFWHQAHSYVRGNWRKREDCAPMIMTKCCHDLDLIQYFAGSKCYSISSMGDLKFFKKENKPKDTGIRCNDCSIKNTCKYSAHKIYIDKWKMAGQKENSFPQNVLTDVFPITEKSLVKAIDDGDYGKCVFECDNNVVDNQISIMQFENGVTATLKMMAFTKYGGRRIRFFGTEGELELIEENGVITLKPYFGEDQIWKIADLTNNLELHGGGDHRMVDELYKVLTGETQFIDTSLTNSVESHIMAIGAEESRLNGGQLVKLEKYRQLKNKVL